MPLRVAELLRRNHSATVCCRSFEEEPVPLYGADLLDIPTSWTLFQVPCNQLPSASCSFASTTRMQVESSDHCGRWTWPSACSQHQAKAAVTMHVESF